MSGLMWYGWSSDPLVRQSAASGGVVTSLLQYLLKTGVVDAVCAVRKGEDLFDSRPVLITDPDEVVQCSGSLYCGTLLVADWVRNATIISPGMKIAAVVKGCDAKALVELAKRSKVDRDDLFLIGLCCSGSLPPVSTRTFLSDYCNLDPDAVQSLGIRNGRLFVELSEDRLEYPLDEVEEAGYGRRDSCRRCDTPIPRQCDLVCGTWGLLGPQSEDATFIEVCSRRGKEVLEKARIAGDVTIHPATQKGIETRSRVEQAMITLSENNRKAQFSRVGTGLSLLTWIMEETSRCIKCYQCTQACPLCTCVDCQTKKPWLVKPGEIPPPFMFHLIRFSHIADSCVNCGQCQDRCAMDIPIAMIMHLLQSELELIFGYHPGRPEGMPVLSKVNQFEEWEHYYGNKYEEMIHLFSQAPPVDG